ncbi:MAG: hypothetical protein RLZZ46_488, partial [Bacteroidota bacterium]
IKTRITLRKPNSMKVKSGGYSLLVFSLFSSVFFIHSCKKKPDSVFPSEKSITQAVYASGLITPFDEYLVYAQSDGIVIDILHHEGDSVKAGECLLKIRSLVQDAKARGARAALNLAEVNAGEDSPVISEALSMWQSLRNKFLLDSLNFVRFTNLKKENSISQIDYERAELQYKNSRNDLRSSKAKIDRLKLQLNTEREQAAALNTGVEDELGNTSVKAESEGLVYQILKEKGEAVRRGEVVARVGSKSRVFLKLQVDEADYSLIKIGQKVIFSAEVYGKNIHEAVVTKVYSYISKSEQSFRIDAQPVDSLLPVLSGGAAEANIIIGSRAKALVIPTSFISQGDSVVVLKDNKEMKIHVKTGMRDLEFVEILSGLDLNTAVYKP